MDIFWAVLLLALTVYWYVRAIGTTVREDRRSPEPINDFGVSNDLVKEMKQIERDIRRAYE